MFIRFLLAFMMLCMSYHAIASITPDRKEVAPKQPREKVVPFIAGPTAYGFAQQNGRDVTITGHERWQATGRIRSDGKLAVTWEDINGTVAYGLYAIHADGSIQGRYGYADSCQWDDDGGLAGVTFTETLRVKDR